MNNTDFRRLVQSTPHPQDASPSSFTKPTAPASSLGSRKVSSIPMTPRTVRGGQTSTFAQQLAEQNASDQPRRKFKSTAAPKGVKFGAGYNDRASQRALEEAQDEREQRIKALEEQMKLGQIEVQTFEHLRDQITGGDIGATHLVKGLDRRLLDRIKKGEDVMADSKTGEDTMKEGKDEETVPEVNPEDGLEELEQAEVAQVRREDVTKKGEMAPPPKPVAGVKRSRADILAELKASRKAAEEAKAASQLGSKFRKFDPKRVEPRIEKDEKGREVLITVDENGRVKRKVRKLAVEEEEQKSRLLMPDKAAKPLGMAVPNAPKVLEESEDDDIFAGVGDAYDPLGAMPDDDDDDDASSEEEHERAENAPREEPQTNRREDSPASDAEGTTEETAPVPSTKRNYFNERFPSPDTKANDASLNDPAILETLKRAALQARESDTAEDPEKPKEQSAAAKRLFQRDRDLDDMDMGFGDSRFGDEEEEDGGKIKLSNWKGMGEEDDEDEEDGKKERGGQARKRGKKKRNGDKNSAADVLAAIAKRNA